MSKTASAKRTGSYTEPHSCAGCRRAFWADRSWNGVTVVCPHCGHRN